jgi:YidC/Oxa1 family membrane protein insertase
MDKRTIIALVLIGIIFLLWPVYMRKVVGVRSPSPEKATEIQSPETEQDEVQQEPAPPPSTETIRTTGREPLSRIGQAAAPEEEPEYIDVETNIYKGMLSTTGGGTIVSWRLKEYLGKEGEWVELIPDTAVGNLGIMLGTRVDLSRMVFRTALDSQWVDNGAGFRILRFVRDFPGGGRIEKELLLQDDSYTIEMRVRFISMGLQDVGSAYDVIWTSGLYPTERRIKDDTPYYEAFALQGGEILKTKEKSTGLCEGSTQWVAVRTKYFVMAIIPETVPGNAAMLEGQKTNIRYEEGETGEWKTFQARIIMPYTGSTQEAGTFSVYLGPMDYTQLKSQGVELEKMMNFGWTFIRPFSIAFFYVLQFLYGIVHNYGWAIIIFSIMIKVVLYPLTRKSFQSMRKMQELQPKMAALKEKYKKDPQKLNEETMKLYKQHGVNPMGGCLPMLLQMPVLFALFNLFRTTIMLRQASFLGGLIQDLSAPDRMIAGINVLPILMGATMIIQQKLSTQSPQQKMMAYFMPIFFTFLFYQFSAGLNLYYLMFNILTIAQEILIKKHK